MIITRRNTAIYLNDRSIGFSNPDGSVTVKTTLPTDARVFLDVFEADRLLMLGLGVLLELPEHSSVPTRIERLIAA
jgi:hypothetical protein